jgi:hypothetical protein
MNCTFHSLETMYLLLMYSSMVFDHSSLSGWGEGRNPHFRWKHSLGKIYILLLIRMMASTVGLKDGGRGPSHHSDLMLHHQCLTPLSSKQVPRWCSGNKGVECCTGLSTGVVLKALHLEPSGCVKVSSTTIL